jgi:hypothetical protein
LVSFIGTTFLLINTSSPVCKGDDVVEKETMAAVLFAFFVTRSSVAILSCVMVFVVNCSRKSQPEDQVMVAAVLEVVPVVMASLLSCFSL